MNQFLNSQVVEKRSFFQIYPVFMLFFNFSIFNYILKKKSHFQNVFAGIKDFIYLRKTQKHHPDTFKIQCMACGHLKNAKKLFFLITLEIFIGL